MLSRGWLECPENPWEEPWTWHADFDLGTASCPMIVTDLTGNGHGDLIVGSAHGYGLWWVENVYEGDQRRWVKHRIDSKHRNLAATAGREARDG